MSLNFHLKSATQGTICSSLGEPANNVIGVATSRLYMNQLGVSLVN